MRRETKGTILLIIGFFLFFAIPIIVIITPFHIPMIPGGDIEPTPINSGRYWQYWFSIQGWQALISALLGLALIIIGGRYFVIKK